MLTLGKSKKCWLFCWRWASNHFTDTKVLSVILLTLNNTVRPPLVTYPSLCSTRVTYRTLCHAIGHQLLPTQPCYRECYGFERAFFTLRHFLSYTPSCFFQGFPGNRQFNLKVSKASCWSSKHSPGPAISLNHSNPQKFYTGRFYLGVTAGRLMKNLLLTWFELFSR